MESSISWTIGNLTESSTFLKADDLKKKKSIFLKYRKEGEREISMMRVSHWWAVKADDFKYLSRKCIYTHFLF